MQGEQAYSWVTGARGVISVLVARWRDTTGTVPISGEGTEQAISDLLPSQVSFPRAAPGLGVPLALPSFQPSLILLQLSQQWVLVVMFFFLN